jgi:hypothetical protein
MSIFNDYPLLWRTCELLLSLLVQFNGFVFSVLDKINNEQIRRVDTVRARARVCVLLSGWTTTRTKHQRLTFDRDVVSYDSHRRRAKMRSF